MSTLAELDSNVRRWLKGVRPAAIAVLLEAIHDELECPIGDETDHSGIIWRRSASSGVTSSGSSSVRLGGTAAADLGRAPTTPRAGAVRLLD